MKKKLRVICLALCVVLTCSVWGPQDMQKVSAGSLSSVTSDSIRDKEDQISRKKEEKKNLQSSLTDLKAIKKKLEAQKKDLKNYVKELDRNLEEIEQRIAGLEAQIVVKEEEILQSKQELEAALEKEENQQESMMTHIRIVYERKRPSLIDLLLKATSFGDFLNKADYVEKVVAYDQRIWQDYKASREYVELCKEELELEKEILDEAKAGVEIEQSNLEELIEQKNRDLTAFENDINNKEKAIKEYQDELKAQEEEIAMLEAAIIEEKKQILINNGVVLSYDGGDFVFPIKSYTRVSSDYGWRIHPTLGYNKFHNGVDFAAPKGTPIYAAYDGIVVAAAYNSTMGKYVMIDHGDGLYTIYMHASKLYVEKDDVVVRGETIAGVGTTGRSTGNHLHFSVRLNGEYVSPWEYIDK